MNAEKLVDNLRKKGWSEQDIQEALNVFSQPREEPVSFKILYWIALLFAILGNLFIAIVIVPILLLINNHVIYIVIFVAALAFGALFNSLLSTIESFGGTYIMSTIFMPSLAIINAIFMFALARIFVSTFKFKITPNLISTTAISYAVVFTLPFIFTKLKENIEIIS